MPVPDRGPARVKVNVNIKRRTLETMRAAKLVFGTSQSEIVDSAVALYEDRFRVFEKLREVGTPSDEAADAESA